MSLTIEEEKFIIHQNNLGAPKPTSPKKNQREEEVKNISKNIKIVEERMTNVRGLKDKATITDFEIETRDSNRRRLGRTPTLNSDKRRN